MIPNVTVCRWSSQYLFHTLLALVNLPTGRFLVILLSYGSYLTPLNQATGYATQHDSVPVPSQDKLGGLRQEGHLAIKWGGCYGGGAVVRLGWRPPGLSVPLPLLSSPAPQNPENFNDGVL